MLSIITLIATITIMLFGCIDSWLIYKYLPYQSIFISAIIIIIIIIQIIIFSTRLSGRHMTEVSNIAASGFFDPFVMQ